MTWVYIGLLCYQWSHMFLLNKLWHFVDTRVNGRVFSCLGAFNFDILLPDPCLCSHFVHYYCHDIDLLVLFTDFLVICCFSCYEAVFSCIAENDYWFTVWFNIQPLKDETRSLFSLMTSKHWVWRNWRVLYRAAASILQYAYLWNKVVQVNTPSRLSWAWLLPRFEHCRVSLLYSEGVCLSPCQGTHYPDWGLQDSSARPAAKIAWK
jgi:hypothetical protein